MVAPSKVFEWPLNRLYCSNFIHNLPNQSCTEAFIWNVYNNHLCSAQYYFPIWLFPLILKYRNLSKKSVWNISKNYVQIFSCSAIINALTFYLMCISRRLCGRYIWGVTPYLSAYLASQIIYFLPPKGLNFCTTGILHATIEAMLRQLKVGLVHSQAAQVLVFMVCSLVILRQQLAGVYTGFWFIKPAPLQQDYSEWSLKQRAKEALLDLRTYLGIGLTMDFLSALVHRQLGKMKLKSTSFMISYMGIFRITQCLLAGRMESNYINLQAAFLSGGSFWLVSHNPLTLMSLAVCIASQLLWQEFCTLDVSNSRILAALQRVPWIKLLVSPSFAYLVHSNIFQKDVVNGLARSFINRTGGHGAQRISDLLLLSEESLLTIHNKNPLTRFL